MCESVFGCVRVCENVCECVRVCVCVCVCVGVGDVGTFGNAAARAQFGLLHCNQRCRCSLFWAKVDGVLSSQPLRL